MVRIVKRWIFSDIIPWQKIIEKYCFPESGPSFRCQINRPTFYIMVYRGKAKPAQIITLPPPCLVVCWGVSAAFSFRDACPSPSRFCPGLQLSYGSHTGVLGVSRWGEIPGLCVVVSGVIRHSLLSGKVRVWRRSFSSPLSRFHLSFAFCLSWDSLCARFEVPYVIVLFKSEIKTFTWSRLKAPLAGWNITCSEPGQGKVWVMNPSLPLWAEGSRE